MDAVSTDVSERRQQATASKMDARSPEEEEANQAANGDEQGSH